MSRRVQLHCDLAVGTERAAEAGYYFETVYRPAAMRFEGYVDDNCHILLSDVIE